MVCWAPGTLAAFQNSKASSPAAVCVVVAQKGIPSWAENNFNTGQTIAVHEQTIAVQGLGGKKTVGGGNVSTQNWARASSAPRFTANYYLYKEGQTKQERSSSATHSSAPSGARNSRQRHSCPASITGPGRGGAGCGGLAPSALPSKLMRPEGVVPGGGC